MSETPLPIDHELDKILQEGQQVEGLADLISRRRQYFTTPDRGATPAVPISHEAALMGARLGQLWMATYLDSLGPDDKYLDAETFRDKFEMAKSEALDTMRAKPEYEDSQFDTPVMMAATDAFFLLSPAPVADAKAIGWGMEPYAGELPLPVQRYDS